MRKLLLIAVAALVLANCMALGGIGYYFLIHPSTTESVAPTPRPQAVKNVASPRASPTRLPAPISRVAQAAVPTPLAVATDQSRTPTSELDALASLNPPSNDRIKLAEEYKGVQEARATPVSPKVYKVGDRETFWVTRDMQTSSREQVTATLRYMNDVVYMWVEDGEQVSDVGLKKSADTFATKIYPTDHKYFGSEANPGVDNDPHLHILNTRTANFTLGYFGSMDVLPTNVNSQSNGREMFFVNSRAIKPGTTQYDSVLAHEFTHMVHHNQNLRGEAGWIVEGFGDLGMELNGYSVGHEQMFVADPDLQLNAWDSQPGLQIPHYGAAYLFLSYLLNRFGIDYIRDVFSTNTTGIATIQQALDKHAPGLTFDSVFADWVVANFLDDPMQGARYGYGSGQLGIRPTVGYARYPASGSDTVHQYGTDYIQLLPNGKDVTFSFDGSDTVPIIPTKVHSGKYMWWSGRTDYSDTTLTREVDLRNVKKATLKFWTWYSLEDNWDYAYVSVSTDGGKTWQTLKGNTTTTDDPNAANYGNALSCKSDAGCGDPNAVPQWIQEQMDLTPYAGQKILLRFEQITDEVYAAPGLAIDDIEIPEIGFKDDAENGDNGWTAAGFSRIDNVLPQHFIVQAIEYGATPKVVSIPLDAQNRGTYTTHGLGKDISRVVITVSGSTPVTWEEAEYQYQIQ